MGDKMFIYVVKPGDTLNSIARKFGMDVNTLIEINDISNPNTIVVGEALIILQNLNSIYIVQKGDTLSSIARKYNIPLQELLDINPSLTPPYQLKIGQKLVVEPNEEDRKRILLNGFAYSSSSTEEVANALTDLTFLSIFAYRYNENGNINEIADDRLVRLTENYESSPLMVITNQNEKGSFSSEQADMLLKSPEKQDRLIRDIVSKLKETPYTGLVVDFEYVLPIDVNLYVEFLQKVKDGLKNAGKFLLFVALAPK